MTHVEMNPGSEEYSRYNLNTVDPLVFVHRDGVEQQGKKGDFPTSVPFDKEEVQKGMKEGDSWWPQVE